MDDTEQATDRPQAQPVEIEADGFLMDGDAMALFFRSGGEGAAAGEAAKALRPSAITPPRPDIGRGPAVRAGWCIQIQQYRPSPPL